MHVESFDEKSKNSTRYSLSTKIPEYLNSGVCIFAYGPDDIASIEYLKENSVAFVCSNKTDLRLTLKKLLFTPELSIKFEEQGLELAKAKHNAIQISNDFTNRLLNCYYGEF